MGFLDMVKGKIEKFNEDCETKRQQLLEQKKQNEEYMLQVRNGENMPIIEAPNGLVLQKNEVCHCGSIGYKREVKKETVGYEGGYGGISVKVAKGVTLHSGSTRSHAVKKDVVHEYQGGLFITNKRIIFLPMNEGKGFSIPLKNLIGFSKLSDGFIFQKDNTSYAIRLDKDQVIVIDVVLSGALKNMQ